MDKSTPPSTGVVSNNQWSLRGNHPETIDQLMRISSLTELHSSRRAVAYNVHTANYIWFPRYFMRNTSHRFPLFCVVCSDRFTWFAGHPHIAQSIVGSKFHIWRTYSRPVSCASFLDPRRNIYRKLHTLGAVIVWFRTVPSWAYIQHVRGHLPSILPSVPYIPLLPVHQFGRQRSHLSDTDGGHSQPPVATELLLMLT